MTSVATQIDWRAIGEKLQARCSDPVALDLAIRMAASGIVRWGHEDLGRIVSVEETKQGLLNGEYPWEWTCDLVLRDPPEIIDYKSFARTTLPKWEDRMRRSAQADIYMDLEDIDKFTYRGIDMDFGVHELEREFSHGRLLSVLQRVRVMDEHVLDDVAGKNEPKSCKAFGRPCPHSQKCYGGDNALVEFDFTTNHYTWLEEWWLCPERFRRNRNAEEQGQNPEYTESTELGSLMHLALAEANRTLMQLQT